MSWNNPTALTGDQAELGNALTPAGAGRGLLTPMRCVILKQEDAVDSLIFFFKLTTLFYLFVFWLCLFVMWDLVPRPEMEPQPPVMEGPS